MNESFSLDLLPPDGAIVSGYNFREVAPELLSPFSWSVIGAGMEHGFRRIARATGAHVDGVRPAFVAYAAFRPYHVVSTVQRLHPLLPPHDIWHLFLGGSPPAGDTADRRRAGPAAYASGARTLADVWDATETELDAVAAAVAAIEDRVRRMERAGPLAIGPLLEDATALGRRAWALHMLTTGRALATASFLRRSLDVREEHDTVAEIVRSVAHRLDEGRQPSAQPGRLPADLRTLASYELAADTERFAPWARRMGSVDAGPSERPDVSHQHAVLLTGTLVGRVARRLALSLDRALQLRESSKSLGLRSLHAIRVVLASKSVPYEPADVVLLGPEELLGNDEHTARQLIDVRADELTRASRLALPVDARVRGTQLVALPRRSGTGGSGTPMAPGWARGPLVPEHAAEPGTVVFGRSVDANVVIATEPSGVVTEMASTLSHVAIVCRELRIPLVAHVRFRPEDEGRHAIVDGWTGEVTVDPGWRADADA